MEENKEEIVTEITPETSEAVATPKPRRTTGVKATKEVLDAIETPTVVENPSGDAITEEANQEEIIVEETFIVIEEIKKKNKTKMKEKEKAKAKKANSKEKAKAKAKKAKKAKKEKAKKAKVKAKAKEKKAKAKSKKAKQNKKNKSKKK